MQIVEIFACPIFRAGITAHWETGAPSISTDLSCPFLFTLYATLRREELTNLVYRLSLPQSKWVIQERFIAKFIHLGLTRLLIKKRLTKQPKKKGGRCRLPD